MSRHRKIDIRMWGDAKFRTLSSPEPCGQWLWVYLITGPHTTNLPGLFQTGEAALAEALGWRLEDFRKAFRELSSKGMVEADWIARVVYVPNAIRYNEPESPNVVIHWRNAWEEMPECELKDKAKVNYRQYFTTKGKGFQEAFRKAFGEGVTKYPDGSKLSPSPNQEQEQEQEQDTHPLPPQGGNRGRACDSLDPLFDRFWRAYPNKVARVDAAAVWDELNVDEALLSQILAALKVQRDSEQWKIRRVIPRPDTWLRGRRWMDIGIVLEEEKKTPAERLAEYKRKREEEEKASEARRKECEEAIAKGGGILDRLRARRQVAQIAGSIGVPASGANSA